MENKRGQINTLTGSILAVTLAVIVFVFGLSVLSSLETTSTVNGTVYNETGEAMAKYTGFNDYWSLIILAIVIAVVFGLIFWAFRGGNVR